MGKKYSESDLLDSIKTVSTIYCSKCDNEESSLGDSYDCVEEFFESGWRATPNNCYCPKCAKKYLKQ